MAEFLSKRIMYIVYTRLLSFTLRTREDVDQRIVLRRGRIIAALLQQIAREYLLIQFRQPRGREVNQDSRAVHLLDELLLESSSLQVNVMSFRNGIPMLALRLSYEPTSLTGICRSSS